MSSTNIGARLARFEDSALLKGRGKYVGDISLPRMLESSFVRSPHPHANILSMDTSAARALPGVHAVLTYDDFQSVFATNHPPWDHKTWDFPEHSKPVVIPKDEVCFAGQAVAMVLADLGELKEAKELLTRAYQTLLKSYGPDFPKTKIVKGNLDGVSKMLE